VKNTPQIRSYRPLQTLFPCDCHNDEWNICSNCQSQNHSISSQYLHSFLFIHLLIIQSIYLALQLLLLLTLPNKLNHLWLYDDTSLQDKYAIYASQCNLERTTAEMFLDIFLQIKKYYKVLHLQLWNTEKYICHSG